MVIYFFPPHLIYFLEISSCWLTEIGFLILFHCYRELNYTDTQHFTQSVCVTGHRSGFTMTNNATLIIVRMHLHTGAELSEQIPRSGISGLKGKLPSTGTVPLGTSTATDESAYIITALPTE